MRSLIVLTVAFLASAANGACENFYRLTDGACGQTCLDSKLGICPRGIVTKFGKLTQGTCASQGYGVADGSKSEKAGPCGTLTIDLFTKGTEAAAVSQADACENFYRLTDGACGQTCLNSKLGICPRGIVTKFGKLTQGTCASQGYSVADGSKSEKAGPCGTLTIDLFKKSSAAAAVSSEADCDNYFRLTDGACGQTCLASKIGICPRGVVTKFGDLKPGTCASQGYSVEEKTKSEKAGPCGDLTITIYNK